MRSDQLLLRPARVAECQLAELARLLGLAEQPAGAVRGVTHASREVRPGDLFAALRSVRSGGHGARFAADAAAAGAVAVLTDPAGAQTVREVGLPVLVVPDPRAVLGTVADRIYGRPSERLAVIGITGTAGKTTCAYLIEAGLIAAGRTPALLSTVQTRLGGLVLDSVRTTPEATDLHALLAVAAEQGVDTVVMEVSSHALDQGRVGGVRFAVGGWTNFGEDHLDYHGDSASYFAAKAALFDGRCRVEVLNADDPAQAGLVRPQTVTFSAAGDPAASWYATDVATAGFGQRFTAHGPGGPVRAGVTAPGRHSVANALLSVAALAAVGVEPAAAAAGVAACPGVPGRLEIVDSRDGGVLGVVDYAHKPDSVREVLAALRAVADDRGGQLICVLGAGGERDAGKRPGMGAAAGHLADLVIVTDDNPRSEDPAAIRAAVRAGIRPGAGTVVEVAGRRAAIAEAVRLADPADVVAVLGKGHERVQEIAGQAYPFDDRIELAAALGQVPA